MFYIVLFIISFLIIYKLVDSNNFATYLLYRYSGIISIILFSLAAYQIENSMNENSKRFPTTFLMIGAISYTIWLAKICAITIKTKKQGIFWTLMKTYAYITCIIFIPLGILARKMYYKYEVDRKQIPTKPIDQ